MKLLRLAAPIAIAICVSEPLIAAEPDPIEIELRTELQQLQAAFERNVQAKKAEAIRKYEAKIAAAERASNIPEVNELRAKIAALKNEPPPKPVASKPPTATEQRLLGKWVLENAQENPIADMAIEKTAEGKFRLARAGGGGALAVNGEYEVRGDKLVKIKAPGDSYADLAWRISGTRLKMIEGQYKDWQLRRAKP